MKKHLLGLEKIGGRCRIVCAILAFSWWPGAPELSAEVLMVASGMSGQARIDLYDSETMALLKKGYITPPQLGYVSDLVYDSSGSLFMTSGLSSRVSVYSTNPPALKNATLIAPVVSPYGLVMDSDGLLFLTHNGIPKISVYRKDGTFVREFSISRTNSQSDVGYSLFCTSNNVLYVGGITNRQIKKFSTDGTLLNDSFIALPAASVARGIFVKGNTLYATVGNSVNSYNATTGEVIKQNVAVAPSTLQHVYVDNFGHVFATEGNPGSALDKWNESDGSLIQRVVMDLSFAWSLIPASVTAAPSVETAPKSQTVTDGKPLSLSVVTSGTLPMSYQWFKNGVAITGATSSTFAIPAMVKDDAGAYTVSAVNSAGTVTSVAATVSVNPENWLSNLSVRTSISTGKTLILGAVVSGGAKDILIRASGPALRQFALNGIDDPMIDLYTTGVIPLATNDDWPSSLSTVFTAVGAYPFTFGSKDAALMQNLNGPFTIQATGKGAGTILVEAYDATGGAAPRLVNLSVRNQVGGGGDVLIAGLYISGTGTKRLLIRGVGPGLTQFGVTGVLSDPKVEVFDSNNLLVGKNDDWDANLVAATAKSVGAFDLIAASKDAALLVSLKAGSTYTVVVSGADGGTGDGIIEVYEVY